MDRNKLAIGLFPAKLRQNGCNTGVGPQAPVPTANFYALRLEYL